ncbi:MAG: 30S ribosomal protein S8 [Pseudomonadota bacterium]
MQTDPVGDMLTILRNGYHAGKKVVTVPRSGVKEDILKVLKEEGFIEDVEVTTKQEKSVLMATLRYNDDKGPAIEKIGRVSKPGRRVYVAKKKVPRVRNGYGMAIVTTSMGVMTDKKAREKGVGGEVICEVW